MGQWNGEFKTKKEGKRKLCSKQWSSSPDKGPRRAKDFRQERSSSVQGGHRAVLLECLKGREGAGEMNQQGDTGWSSSGFGSHNLDSYPKHS